MKIFSISAACALLSFAAASHVNAIGTAQLRLSDGWGPDSKTITDNDVGDDDPTLGVIKYSGHLGPRWTVTLQTATTKPKLGSEAVPHLTISSFDTSDGKFCPDITIEFS